MRKIEFSKDEKDSLVRKIQRYFREELDQEIGQFPAEFLLDFFTEEVGAFYYNRGLFDAQTAVQQRVDAISEAIDELEQPADYGR
ncbi:MAG: DUF2164 domain-containing protein [Pseudomonadota bacterium]